MLCVLFCFVLNFFFFFGLFKWKSKSRFLLFLSLWYAVISVHWYEVVYLMYIWVITLDYGLFPLLVMILWIGLLVSFVTNGSSHILHFFFGCLYWVSKLIDRDKNCLGASPTVSGFC